MTKNLKTGYYNKSGHTKCFSYVNLSAYYDFEVILLKIWTVWLKNAYFNKIPFTLYKILKK